MSKTRVAMIGAGAMANSVHYPSLAEFDDVEIAAISDLMPDKLKATAEKYGVEKTYSDYKQMITEVDPEAVYVVMPPMHLLDPVMHCLEQRRNVFIEKPPAVTLTQIKTMARKAEQRGCLTMCGFNRRFTPLVVECKQRVEERGPIELASVTFYKNYFAGIEYYNGAIDILTCDAIHALDLVRYLCGGECTNLASSVHQRGGESYPNSWQALMEFDTGATGVLMAHWVAGKRFHHAELHAKGISAYTEFEVDADIWADNGAPVHLDAKELTGAEVMFKTFGFMAENRHFIDCVQQGEQPLTNFADAIKTMELVDRIYHGTLS